MEETEVESSRRRIPGGAIVLGLVVAVVAVWITVDVATDRDPEETVEAYLEAVAEKDVDGALALVNLQGYGVPYGDTATFLTPEAIRDDWWVVSVREIDREYGTRAIVEAVIAGPDGTAKGEFTVVEHDGEWELVDPFLDVRFPASPLSYIRVNDRIVPQSPDDVTQSYALFPGTYRFYETDPDVVSTATTDVVAVFPRVHVGSYGQRGPSEIVPSRLTAGRDVLAKAQDAIKRRIDDCASFATATPPDCPFATDGEIDTPAGVRVTRLHSLTWKVKTYPRITLADERTSDTSNQGLTVRTGEPGTVTLSGSGVDTEDKPTSFTVTCDIDPNGYLVTIAADGEVALHESPALRQAVADPFNTCRRNT